MIKSIACLIVIFASSAWASHHQVIDTLGSSKAGQFVALEEYGYRAQTHSYYVSIKIMNVWKKEYVGSPVEVEIPALRPGDLTKARAQAKVLAKGDLDRYKISG